jgi:hypothetical protein
MYPVREDILDLLDLPALKHPPVITHLRKSKRLATRPLALILLITPKRYRPAKQVARNISSPLSVRSSLYALRGIQIASPPVLSPFKFDPDFYQQGNILNGNIDAEMATYRVVNNRYIKAMRVTHERIIDNAKLNEYKPLEMPDPPRLIRTHLLNFTNIKDLASFFEMFMKDEDFDVIVANTNKYIEQYLIRYLKSN